MNRKRLFKLPFLLVMLLSLFSTAIAETGFSAFIVDQKSGEVLFEHDAYESRYPASITKVMTLYLAFEDLKAGRAKLNQPIRFSQHAASQPPSKIGVPAGEAITLDLAIKALIVKSANDVATAVAENLAGSERAFVERMNRKAKELGLYNTHFVNPHGLFDERQVSTASDLLQLGIAIYNDFPQYYPLFKTESFSYNGTQFTSHNRVNKNFPGADGIKTGYIRKSGFNLLTSAKQGDRRLFAVILGGRTTKLRDDLMMDLLASSFQQLNSGRQVALNPVITRDMTVLFKPDHPNATDKTRLVSKSPARPNLPKVNLIAQSSQEIHPNSSAAIQVGAFSSYQSAQNQARLVHRQVREGQIEIVNKDDLYRALLVGFDYDRAHMTCEELKRNNTSCFVLAL